MLLSTKRPSWFGNTSMAINHQSRTDRIGTGHISERTVMRTPERPASVLRETTLLQVQCATLVQAALSLGVQLVAVTRYMAIESR